MKKEETRKSIDELFQTDQKAEKDEGVILDYGDFRVRIARAGGNNTKFSRVLQAKMKPFRRQIETDTMDEEVATKLMVETYAEAVILDMDVKVGKDKYEQGILRKTGVVPFTKENVVSVFTEMKEFFRDVQSQANNVSLFRTHQLEEDTKNS
jgi:hypothetical protein